MADALFLYFVLKAFSVCTATYLKNINSKQFCNKLSTFLLKPLSNIEYFVERSGLLKTFQMFSS